MNRRSTAALAVAKKPGVAYNPLFIYGDTGIGKTHLMQAIAHYIIEHSNKKVLYVTSDTFTQEIVDALKIDKNSPIAMKNFREKYRNVDVLLIDDIQFIAGKKATQEEFFHTFNDLYQNKKQIILASDRPPFSL